MMFRFAYPVLLLLLLPVCLWFFLGLRKKPGGLRFSVTGHLAGLVSATMGLLARAPLYMRCCLLVLLVLAAARPQWYNVSRDIRSSGVDILLCLDASGSMQAMDFTLDGRPVTRLVAVQKVVGDFIRKREADRIGLVVFGQEAFTQAPLTLDKGLLLGLVDRLEIGMAGDQTAIGSAIAIGGKRLKDIQSESKILILLTDGRNNAGDLSPMEATRAVRALGIKIYTIGVGGEGPAPFVVDTIWGPRTVMREVDLDEKTLQDIAEAGGGRYFRASDSSELARISDLIDQEEKTEVKVKEFFHFRELYPYLLIPGLVLFFLEILLMAGPLRRIP